MEQLKLLKINFNGEIKRAILPEKFEDLLTTFSKCFSHGSSNVEINYIDDEGDKLTISNQFDLDQARNFLEKNNINLLKITVEKKKENSVVDINEVMVVKEKKQDEFEFINKLEESQLTLTKEELSVIVTDEVNKELEGLKKKIVEDLLNKTSEKPKEEKNKAKEEKVDEYIITHYGYTCDGCKSSPIIGTRYKCLTCPNFDFCLKCVEKQKHEDNHTFEAINATHTSVKCDGCGKYPLTGTRYKCSVCKNFDYCEKCEESSFKTHKHPFLKIRQPELAPAKITCTLHNDQMKDAKVDGSPQRCGRFGRGRCGFFKNLVNKFHNKDEKENTCNKFEGVQDFFFSVLKNCNSFGKTFCSAINENVQKLDFNQIEATVENTLQKLTGNFNQEQMSEVDKLLNSTTTTNTTEVKKSEKISFPPQENKTKVEDIEIINIPVDTTKTKVEEPEQKKVEKVEKVEEPEQKKVEKVEVKVEVPNEPKKEAVNPLHLLMLKDIKNMYDLSAFSDEQLLNAIALANGVPDDVFLHLFN